MLDNFVYELIKFEFQTPSKRTDRRDSSQLFEPDRVGMEAARPCFPFLYYPTLLLSISAKARRRPEEVETTPDCFGNFYILRPDPAASSLSLQIDKRQSETKEDDIEREMKIT